MTTFSYSSGDPNNLTGGIDANMADIKGPFTDIETFINGANLDTTNLAVSAKPSTILGQFAGTTIEAEGLIPGSAALATYWLGHGQIKVSGTADLQSVPFTQFGSGGYAVTGLNARARVLCCVLVNNTAPGVSFTFGLHGISAMGGGAGAISITSIGAFGNTAAISTPAANSQNQNVSADFAIPTSGNYGLAVVTSGTMAANSVVQVRAALQLHWT